MPTLDLSTRTDSPRTSVVATERDRMLHLAVKRALAVTGGTTARLRGRPTITAAIALLCLVGVAGLYAADLILAGSPGIGLPRSALFNLDRASPAHKTEISRLAARTGATVDLRDRVEVIADLRAHKIEAVPAVTLTELLDTADSRPSSGSRDPNRLLSLGGISRALTVLCNQSGSYVTYQSDEHGFRNPPGLWDSDHLELAVVGQSFSQGYCVADGKGFVDALRGSWPLTLNLSNSGASSLLHLAAISEYLPRYAPKVVLWVFSEGNDLKDVVTESMDPMAMQYLDPNFSQQLIARQPDIDLNLRTLVARHGGRLRDTKPRAVIEPSLLERTIPVLKLWHLREMLSQAYGIRLGPSRSDREGAEAALRVLKTSLERAQTLTRSWGGTLHFIYLPSWARYRNRAPDPQWERAAVLGLVQALGIPVIDVEPVFHAQKDPLSLFPFRRFGHYNEAGNRLVAQTVHDALSGPLNGHSLVE